MGTLYYARNTETRKVYELGKGAWERLTEDGRIDCADRAALLRKVRAVIDGWVVPAGYDEGIVQALCALGSSLELVDDRSTDIHDGDGGMLDGFTLVGTRYIE